MKINRSSHILASAAIPKRNHLLLVVAFFVLVGCVSVNHVSGGMWLWGLTGIGALLVWLFHKNGLRCTAGLAVLCFALGSLYAHAVLEISMPEAGSYEANGYVYGEAEERSDQRLSFVLGDITLDGEKVSGKAYCTLRYADTLPQLFDGAQVSFTGYVYHPSGKSGEPRMDFRLWMRQQGYRFGLSIYDDICIANTPAAAPAKDAASRARQVFASAFERIMGENGRIAMALLFGEREGLTEDEYAAFSKLGIAHVMSVSGLHVGLVGSMLMLFLKRFHLKRRTSLLILSFFLLDYCALTGFSAASVRAAVMLVCVSLGRLLRRRGDRITTLCAAMIAVLIIDPLSALSAGFVLSFCAMLGIILYARPMLEALDHLWPQPKVNVRMRTPETFPARLQMQIKSLLAVSVTAQLGVLLPTMRYFQQLPLYSILINMLIVPLVGSVLVPLYLAALICSLFPLIGTAVGSAASAATNLLLWLVELLGRLPYASIRTAAPPVLVCIGLGAAMILLSRRVPRRLRTRMTAALLIAAVALGGWALQRPAKLRYIQLDAGQADAALLLDGNQTIVIDTGTDGSDVIDYLRYENREVDALLLTHLHMDHAGGVPALLTSGIPIHRIYLPANAETQKLDENALAVYDLLLSQDIPLTTLASGDELRYNRSMIRVLWPEAKTVRSGHGANDYPLALAIDLDGFTLLSPSDLTGKYERYAAIPADVLKAAHHGSRESSLDDFLDFVNPAYALLTVSGGSSSLPSSETLERLQERGIGVFRTDECGDITLSVENGQLIITPYKERTIP